MSDVLRPRGPSLVGRVAWATVLIVAAVGTGLYWQGQRQERTVDATADVSLQAVITEDGVVEVIEELLVSGVDGSTVTRILVAEDGVIWQGARDDAGQPAQHTTVPVAGGLAVTFPAGAQSMVVELSYALLGATDVGRDAVELAWNLTDDRNSLAINRLEAEVAWLGGEAAEILEVEAPGVAPTIVAGDGGARIALGEIPAHHDVEVHAALHLSAVPAGLAGDRSVMEDMAAAAVLPERDQGGGPWWLPVVAALLYLLGWAIFHQRGQDSDIEWPGFITDQPSSHSPAELAWVLRRGQTRHTDLAATLADLHARAIITTTPSGWTLKNRQVLLDHEQVLVDWLFHGSTTVVPTEVVAVVQRDPGRWRSTRRAFEAAVEHQPHVTALVPRRAGDEAVLGVGVAAAALVVGGVVGTALGQPAWIVCVVVGALAIVFSDTLARLSADGARLTADWTSYAEWLSTQDAVAVAVPGHAMVLGIRGPDDDPVIAAALSLVDDVEHAFVTATSFMAAPRRRARAVGASS